MIIQCCMALLAVEISRAVFCRRIHHNLGTLEVAAILNVQERERGGNPHSSRHGPRGLRMVNQARYTVALYYVSHAIFYSLERHY